MVLKSDLAAKIKQLCSDKGISLSTLEREAGYSLGMISRWAASSEDFNVFTKLLYIADRLDVTVDELLGRQKIPSQAGRVPETPLEPLLEATCSSTLPWTGVSPAGLPGGAQFPCAESGRPLCGVWWCAYRGLHLALCAYCDDPDDPLEPMDLALYATPGHGIPPGPVPVPDGAALQTLYTQVLLQLAFQPEPVDQNAEQSKPDGRTIPFRRATSG